MKAKLFKKASSAILAAAVAANCAAVGSIFSVNAAGEKYEFEDGTYDSKCVFGNTVEGFSGTGYVDSQEGDLSVTVNVESTGIYELTICYCLPSDRTAKVQDLYVNDVAQGDVGFAISDTFTEISVSGISLKEGENTITFKKDWGWILFDYLTVETAELPEVVGNNTLSDKQATKETQSLMNYLADTYGNHIISGQQELYGQAGETEFEYIYNLSGEYPAIRGFDYMNWTQGVNWDDGTNDRIINWVNNKNGIATVAWHWFVPLDMANYDIGDTLTYDGVAFYNKKGSADKYTTFSPAKAVQEGTEENEFINKDIEMIAKALQELQDNNIPVIFRPLHEAEGSSSLDGSGSWFWWGNDGAEAYVDLWHYLYDKLTNEYGLHNLIWEWNSYTYDTSSAWYPGDDYVDLVAYDKYNASGSPNESSISGTFYSLVEMYEGKKMVAMAENDTIPSLDNLITDQAKWLYFCPWYAEYITSSTYNNPDTVTELYQSDYVITLDELPADLYSYSSESGSVTTTTTPSGDTPITTTTTTTVAPDPDVTTTTTEEEPAYEVRKYNIDLTDRNESNELVLTIEGEPGAYTNGCVGYSDGADWVSIDWETTIGDDGTAQITVDITDVPADVTKAEAQIWWSGIDKTLYDCEMTDYAFVSEAEPDILYGDVDGDGEVTINDAVKVMTYVTNKEAYPLTDEQLDAADVYQRGDGISNMDALAIQKKAAQLISMLPESNMEA
ncbi:MAG: glycoside hydrolase [Ruminococcus sp.]|nr:glycoside hydrolase [Ruminococcus sp.]